MGMAHSCYGQCETCAVNLTSRYHSLSRHVEQCQYTASDDDNTQLTRINILHAEQVTQYCGSECAQIGAYSQLNDRGISLNLVGDGPITPCSKCSKPMDLTQAHIAYELMDQTEIRQPWITCADTHDSETVARVCSNCDGDLAMVTAFDAMDEPKDSAQSAVAQNLVELLK